MNLPYRVVNVCTGDLGRGQAQKYDIETWMPSRNSYGETHSASRFYEFQARRMNLRYKNADGKNLFCHTLNNTVIASVASVYARPGANRTLITIFLRDGSEPKEP
jgi:seryl-tRNA synthetase